MRAARSRTRYLASVAKGGRVPEARAREVSAQRRVLICPQCGGHFEARSHRGRVRPTSTSARRAAQARRLHERSQRSRLRRRDECRHRRGPRCSHALPRRAALVGRCTPEDPTRISRRNGTGSRAKIDTLVKSERRGCRGGRRPDRPRAQQLISRLDVQPARTALAARTSRSSAPPEQRAAQWKATSGPNRSGRALAVAAARGRLRSGMSPKAAALGGGKRSRICSTASSIMERPQRDSNRVLALKGRYHAFWLCRVKSDK